MKKNPLKSKTINGALANTLGILVLVGSYFGIEVSSQDMNELQTSIDGLIVAIVSIWQLISNILVVWGRIKAKSDITWTGS